MPERKLVKHGPSTFMVSLPKKWVDHHAFKKGDSITYEERPDSIVFYAGDFEREGSSTEFSADAMDRTTLLHTIRGLYRKGYAEIVVRFSEQTTHHFRTDGDVRISAAIAREVERLIGVEVASYSRNAIVIKQLAEPSQEEFESSFRRILLQIRMAMSELVEDLQSKDPEAIQGVKDKQDSVVKLISLCLRILHHERKWVNAPYLTTILMELETLSYLVDHFARFVYEDKLELSPNAIGVVETIVKLQEVLEQLIYVWDNEKAARFHELRSEMDERLEQLKPAEKHIGYFMHPLQIIQRSVIQARLTMEDELFG